MDAYWDEVEEHRRPERAAARSPSRPASIRRRWTTCSAGDAYADRVRASTVEAQSIGITGIPAFVLDDRLLILGAQPREVFEQRLRAARRVTDPVAQTRRMQALVSELWRLEGPDVENHIGDVAWHALPARRTRAGMAVPDLGGGRRAGCVGVDAASCLARTRDPSAASWRRAPPRAARLVRGRCRRRRAARVVAHHGQGAPRVPPCPRLRDRAHRPRVRVPPPRAGRAVRSGLAGRLPAAHGRARRPGGAGRRCIRSSGRLRA